MPKLKRLSIPVLLLVLFACAVSPTGRQQLTMLAPQQLDNMGAQAFDELKRTKPIETSSRVNGYVRCVAQAVVQNVGGPREGWEVVVFRDRTPNAFTLPGGKIGVHTGLLQVASTQDQLATVIGHEVGHLLANHVNERMSQQMMVQGGLGMVDALSRNPGSATHQTVMAALGLGAQVGVLLPFSRTQESEADTIGLQLMARSGFDPRQSVVLWNTMERMAGGGGPEFISTHPDPGNRARSLESMMGAAMRDYEQARASGRRPRCG